jgi:hypothetical protein
MDEILAVGFAFSFHAARYYRHVTGNSADVHPYPE